MAKRGRPTSIARQVANDLGVNIRTVQRALAAKRPKEPETEQDAVLRRFMVAFRNFATFCRDNPVDTIGGLTINAEQSAKLNEWNAVVLPWLRRLNGNDDT